MKVKMLTMSAGPSGTRQIGEVIEVSDEEGQQLIDGRYAVAVDTTKANAKNPEAGKFDVEGFLGQAKKKLLAGLAKVDALWLTAVREAEAAGRNRADVLEAIDAEIANHSEEGAGA